MGNDRASYGFIAADQFAIYDLTPVSYTRAYPDAIPDAFAALGYDAARLLITAIRHAGSTDPAAVLSALAAIRGFDGVTGELSYPADSRIPVKAVTILKVEGGGYRLVQQLIPHKTPAL